MSRIIDSLTPEDEAKSAYYMSESCKILDKNRTFQSLPMEHLVKAFKALPTAPPGFEQQRSAWTIVLQYPTSYFDTGDEENLELTILRVGMLHAAQFPCKRSLLVKAEYYPYLLSIILKAFTEQGQTIMDLDLENYESNLPNLKMPTTELAQKDDFPWSADTISAAVQAQTPIGMLPAATYGVLRKKPSKHLPKLTLYRPNQIYVRDARIYTTLFAHSHYFGLKELQISPLADFSSAYAKKSGVARRKDVTFCAMSGCTSLKKSHPKCSKCLVAYYCSADHQKKAWPEHKMMCAGIQEWNADYQAEKNRVKLPSVVQLGGTSIWM